MPGLRPRHRRPVSGCWRYPRGQRQRPDRPPALGRVLRDPQASGDHFRATHARPLPQASWTSPGIWPSTGDHPLTLLTEVSVMQSRQPSRRRSWSTHILGIKKTAGPKNPRVGCAQLSVAADRARPGGRHAQKARPRRSWAAAQELLTEAEPSRTGCGGDRGRGAGHPANDHRFSWRRKSSGP